MAPETDEAIRQSLLQLMEETLHSHQGMYTEPGTSLIETLASIDASQASRPHPPLKETIAGHAYHAGYYLRNALDLLSGRTNGDFDVPKSWEKAAVTPEEWSAIRRGLEEVYGEVMHSLAGASDWTHGGKIAVVIGMTAHSAYHLGAIRQLKDL